MTFAPATGYRWLLAASALAICVLIAAAVWPPRRRSRLRPRHAAADLAGSGRPAGVAGLGRIRSGRAAVALVLALVGGPLVPRSRP